MNPSHHFCSRVPQRFVPSWARSGRSPNNADRASAIMRRLAHSSQRGSESEVVGRAAFTLVELLVVVGILAVLAALLTPAVMNARLAARNAAIKTELDLLHMAVMNYRNEYGSFPPCLSDLTATGAAARHIQRIFPRCTNVASQLGSTAVAPDLALAAWLNGYTSDPTSPVTGGTRRKMFDFDQSRLVNGAYAPSRLPNSPFVYIDNTQYLNSSGNIVQFTAASGTYAAQRIPTSPSGNFSTVSQPAFNADTFQILCAGLDQIWNTDDDLSNFWPGTRKQYLDNLATQ